MEAMLIPSGEKALPAPALKLKQSAQVSVFFVLVHLSVQPVPWPYPKLIQRASRRVKPSVALLSRDHCSAPYGLTAEAAQRRRSLRMERRRAATTAMPMVPQVSVRNRKIDSISAWENEPCFWWPK